jgi:hypothetical protein
VTNVFAIESAFCVSAFLHIIPGTYEDGVCAVTLIASKTRVAPLKKVALLRLELLVALIGASLGNYIGTHLKMEKTQMHTTKQWKPFAENGAKEIQSLTEPLKWRHCCGNENLADAGNRGPIN